VAIVGWLMIRFGSRWKYYKLFGALMGAAGFGGLTVATWHERHAWLTALFVVTTLANMAGIFDELGNLKKIASTRGLENAE